jgi:hypothetical protein
MEKDYLLVPTLLLLGLEFSMTPDFNLYVQKEGDSTLLLLYSQYKFVFLLLLLLLFPF